MQLFDDSGRYCGLPQPVISPHVRLEQPRINYDWILSSTYADFPPPNPKNPIGPVTAAQVAARFEAFLEKLRHDDLVSNSLKGVHLPLVFPRLSRCYRGSVWNQWRGRCGDYGTILRDIFLPAMKQCLWVAAPRRWFANHLGKLSEQIDIVPGSRYDQLVARMFREHVIGIFFPLALLGFSAFDCRRLIHTLPKNFLLSGGFDVATAFVCYPKVLARDSQTPVITMPALNWRDSPGSLALVETWQQGTVVSNEAQLATERSTFSAGLLAIEDSAH